MASATRIGEEREIAGEADGGGDQIAVGPVTDDQNILKHEREPAERGSNHAIELLQEFPPNSRFITAASGGTLNQPLG
jgi:hypothetical protein